MCDFELEAHTPANLMLDVQANGASSVVTKKASSAITKKDVGCWMLDVQVNDASAGVDEDTAARCPTVVEVADAVLFLCSTPAMPDVSGFVHTKVVSSHKN